MKSDLSQITRREFVRVLGLGVGNLLVQSSLSFSNEKEAKDLGEWNKKADLDVGLTSNVIEVVSDKIYIIGGAYERGRIFSSGDVRVYNSKTDCWSKKSALFTPEFSIKHPKGYKIEKGFIKEICYSGLAGGVINGKIYFAGGLAGPEMGAFTVDNFFVYDPSTSRGLQLKSMLQERSNHGAGVINGKLYIVGGCDRNMLPFLEVYDPKTNKWERKADMPTARRCLGTGVVNGKLYVVGGDADIFTPEYRVLPDLEVYDPKTNKWERKADMPTARMDLGVGVIKGKLYAVGGEDKNNFINVLEVYDPKTNKWLKLEDMPITTKNPRAVVINDKLYVIGKHPIKRDSVLEVFTPPRKLLAE